VSPELDKSSKKSRSIIFVLIGVTSDVPVHALEVSVDNPDEIFCGKFRKICNSFSVGRYVG
jgi:hypothetical protein